MASIGLTRYRPHSVNAVLTPFRDRSRRAEACPRPGLLSSGATAVAVAIALLPMPATAATTTHAVEPAEAEAEPADGSRQDNSLSQAMAAYERGTQNYNLAQYEAALADFKEAATLYASPDFQYNIGLCYEKLGKYDEAVRAYVTYLKTKPDAADRPNVEDRISRLQKAIEEQKNEPNDPATPVAPVQPPPDDPGPQEQADPDSGRPLIIAGAALAGLGGAVALGGGIAFGALARQRSMQIDEIQTGGNPEDLGFSEAERIDREGKRLEGVQIGMVAGGAALAVTGAVLLALGFKKRNAVKASAWLGPSTAGLHLTGRF